MQVLLSPGLVDSEFSKGWHLSIEELLTGRRMSLGRVGGGRGAHMGYCVDEIQPCKRHIQYST